MDEIIRYSVSNDGKGLVAHLKGGSNYHIHSDELTGLQEWLLDLLKKNEQLIQDAKAYLSGGGWSNVCARSSNSL